ncbi:MAG: hypothetical protein ABI589_05255 [Burkholderiales bacterium]
MFADGTGGRDSVSNSSMERGDINFRFVITDDNDKQPDLTGANLDAFVEEFKAAFAPTRTSRFIGVANTTLIGTLAADMGFERRHVFNNTWFQKARVIATRTAGRYYSLQCAYPITSAAEYNPVCESIAASVRLTK